MNQAETVKYVYGPVHSWRSGTSLGIDPIGEVSTCSFNCTYCQLGVIQNITTDIKTYVPTEKIISDLKEMHELGIFQYEDLDVITFAGSGEPTLAENLDEIISEIKKIVNPIKKVPISILTNATMFNNAEVRSRAMLADEISLKLDAPNDKYLKIINQAADGISISSIISGIKEFKKDFKGKVGLQIMFMPKYIKDDTENFLKDLAKLIDETGVEKLQINTPTRPKPINDTYHIETRGNHYADKADEKEADYKLVELPTISKEEAFKIEDKLKEFTKNNLEVINVYKR